MKNICILIMIFLLEGALSFSQNSSTLYLRDTDFSFFNRAETFQSTGEKKKIAEPIDLENVMALTFLQGDSLELIAETGNPVYTRLADIHEVGKYKKRISYVLGITLGAIGGGILGGVIGWTAAEHILEKPEETFKGALAGALGGGVLGAIITHVINYTTLELFSVPDKEKKAKLIKFLREKN